MLTVSWWATGESLKIVSAELQLKLRVWPGCLTGLNGVPADLDEQRNLLHLTDAFSIARSDSALNALWWPRVQCSSRLVSASFRS